MKASCAARSGGTRRPCGDQRAPGPIGEARKSRHSTGPYQADRTNYARDGLDLVVVAS